MNNDTQTPPAADNMPQTTPHIHGGQQQKTYSPMEKSLVTELRKHINKRGNFKFKLEDYSQGYAAGKGISELEAEKQIREIFENEMGVDINTYLNNDRVSKGKEIDQDR